MNLNKLFKYSFARLVEIIEINPIFQNNSQVKQAPVFIQLMVVQGRLDCDGNGSSIGRHARQCSFSHGSVCLFTSRIFLALLSIKENM
jgi:hypothetical protein